MSRDHSKSRVITILAVVGLLMSLSVPRANAVGSANYSGRYACTVATAGDFATAVIKYGPNGGGAYNGGTLIASVNAFSTFPNAAGNYCEYSLDIGMSAYVIDSTGVGFETLSWTPTASTASNASCPAAFVDQTAIGLSTDINSSGSTMSSVFVDNNLLGVNTAGHGHCLK